jgi:hypothetical protein
MVPDVRSRQRNRAVNLADCVTIKASISDVAHHRHSRLIDDLAAVLGNMIFTNDLALDAAVDG